MGSALTTPTPGATIRQSAPGSCVSACGDILTGGARSQDGLLGALGEWSNPGALADELGGPWVGHYTDVSGALTAARRGPMGAVLQAPVEEAHMVVTSPLGRGRFNVLDPFDGSGYIVDSAWIRQYVAGVVYR